MDCLKTIGTPGALEAISAFVEQNGEDEANLDYARDIMWEFNREAAKKQDQSSRDSFRNPFEDDVEYIKIPRGTYKYSLSKKMETVPDLYFCKYPVTNKRYRRFISYLSDRERELERKLPLDVFAEKMFRFAQSIKGFAEYSGNKPTGWANKFRSRYDDDKRFKGDDQPVVGVAWYAARAYCFWLSCLEAAIKRGEKLETIDDIDRLASLYRLPTEVEWEWAAGGEPDGSIREYPWAREKGPPKPELANYGKNVGATTPVGRYPEGATPSGLMDMAGNVWEWMDNYYDADEDVRALRGGSWLYADGLRCSARLYFNPEDHWNDLGLRPAALLQS